MLLPLLRNKTVSSGIPFRSDVAGRKFIWSEVRLWRFDFQKTVNAIWWPWFTTAEIELEEINFFYKIEFRWIVARFTVKSPTVQIILTGRSIQFEQRAPSIGGFAFFGICARTARFREFQPKHKRLNFWWAIDWRIWTLNLIEIKYYFKIFFSFIFFKCVKCGNFDVSISDT